MQTGLRKPSLWNVTADDASKSSRAFLLPPILDLLANKFWFLHHDLSSWSHLCSKWGLLVKAADGWHLTQHMLISDQACLSCLPTSLRQKNSYIDNASSKLVAILSLQEQAKSSNYPVFAFRNDAGKYWNIFWQCRIRAENVSMQHENS